MLVRCGLAGKTLRFDGADEVLQILRAVTQGWSLCEIPEPQGNHEIGIRRDGDVYSIEEIGHQMLREPSAVSAACSLVAILLNRLVENDPSLLALHAGAVAIGARTIIFPATHRAGKSTMAAALALRGHRLVAEDILPLDCGSAGMAAVASGTAPRLRLPLPPSSGLRFRVSAWLRAGPDDGYYRYLRLPARSRCGFGERIGIGAFLFLERDASCHKPQLRAVSKADAMRILLLQNFGTAAPPVTILDRMEALSGHCPGFLLRYSRLDMAVSLLEAAFGADQPLAGLWARLEPARPDLGRVAGVDMAGRPASAPRDRIVCRREGVVARMAEDCAFLADQTNGGIFALDLLGTAIWQLMEQPIRTSEVVAAVQSTYPHVPPGTIAGDVAGLVGQLLESGMAVELGQAEGQDVRS